MSRIISRSCAFYVAQFEKQIKKFQFCNKKTQSQRIECYYTKQDGERWFVVVLHNKIHGQGNGTLLLNRLKERETQLNGWMVDHDNEKKRMEASAANTGLLAIRAEEYVLSKKYLICFSK